MKNKQLLILFLLVIFIITGCGGGGGGNKGGTPYSVGGKITRLDNSEGIPYVNITFSNGTASVKTRSDGTWSASVSGAVTITPKLTGWAFEEQSAYVIGAKNDLDFIGTEFPLDGKILFNANGTIYSANADGSNQSPFSLEPNLKGYAAKFSPNGAKIAFTGYNTSTTAYDIYVMNVDGSNIQAVTNNADYDTDPIWVSDTDLVYISCKGGNYGLYKNNLLGTAEDLVVDFATDNKSFARTPVWSSAVSLLAYEKNGEIYTIKLDRTGGAKISSGFSNSYPNWSPDGSKIVYKASSALIIYNRSDAQTTSIPISSFVTGYWSPGSKLAYADNGNIYTINSDGTGKTEILRKVSFSDNSVFGWFDDSKILYNHIDSDNPDIYVMRSDGRFQTRLTFYNNAYLTSWQHN